jgi:hypothetical protein
MSLPEVKSLPDNKNPPLAGAGKERCFMLVYVTDLGKTGKVYLYHPNSNNECTLQFLGFFKDSPFEVMTRVERKKHNTDAYFKTNEETFMYWRDLFSRLQHLFDVFDERDMLDELKMNGKPIYVPVKQKGESGDGGF